MVVNKGGPLPWGLRILERGQTVLLDEVILFSLGGVKY
jgi:hypothetical protein